MNHSKYRATVGILAAFMLFSIVQSAPAQAVMQTRRPVRPTMQLQVALPDITVAFQSIRRPSTPLSTMGTSGLITPGTPMGKRVRIAVKNIGSVDTGKFFVDVVLSSDTSVPVQLAVYSPVFREDVLLRGGRLSVKNLSPGRTEILSLPGEWVIPERIRPGTYYLAAVADSGQRVQEKSERNNLALQRIKVYPPPAPAVQINSIGQVGLWPSGSGHFEVSLNGSGFGNAIGSKTVHIGSHEFGAANMELWSATQVIVWLPYHFPLGNRYDIRVRENGQTVSNVKQNVLLYMDITGSEFCTPGGSPIAEAPAGTTIEMNGLFGDTQGVCVVKFGGVNAQIVSWAHNHINFVLPNLSPGQYPVFVEKNGERVSFEATFRISAP